MNKIIRDINVKQYLIITISLIIPFIVYTAILTIDLPNNIGELIRHEVSWLLIIFAGLLYLSYSLKGWLGISLSLTTTLALFAFPLARLWSTGVGEIFAWGGLLTWTDTDGYYTSATNLLQGLTMSPTIHNARPIFVGMLSTFLGLTQQNLQITLAILTAFVAISCFFVAREIQETFGNVVGVLVIICLFIFIRPLIGSLMTENLGLCLGNLSFAMLLRGARQMKINISLLGIFVLTIALNARTGALFVLPALLFWGAYVFRQSKWFSEKFLLGGFSVILLGFILNSLLLKLIGHPDGSSSYGNFAFMFYGVITQTDWTQIFKDYPEINELGSDKAIEKEALTIVWQTIRDNPLNSVKGVIYEWRKFFLKDNISIFFIERNQLEFSLRFFALLGLFTCFFHRKKPHASLIIIYAFGVFVSIPFLAGSFRTYASTVIIFSLLSGVGLALILQKIVYPIFLFIINILPKNSFYHSINLTQFLPTKNHPQMSPIFSWQDKILPIFSLLLIILSFIGPIIIKKVSHPPDTSNVSCPSGLETFYFRNNPGSSINLVSDDRIMDTHLPNIRISDFRRGFQSWKSRWGKDVISLEQLEPGLTLFNAHNWTWLVTKSDLIPQEQGWILACGIREKAETISLFHAHYLHPLSSK